MVFNEVAYDLERIGDYSCQIANFTLKESYEVDPEILDNLRAMFKTSKKMVRYSTEAFLNEKLDLKRDVGDYQYIVKLSRVAGCILFSCETTPCMVSYGIMIC